MASRLMYQSLPAGDYPNTAAVAPTCTARWRSGPPRLDRLLEGLGLTRDPSAWNRVWARSTS